MQSEDVGRIDLRNALIDVISVFLDFAHRVGWDFVLDLFTGAFSGYFAENVVRLEDSFLDVLACVGIKQLAIQIISDSSAVLDL